MGGYRDRTTNTVNKIFDVAIRKYQLLENICEDDHELSFAIGSIYDPVHYDPQLKLDEREKRAKNHHHYNRLSFHMLLLGETEEAKKYLEKAIEVFDGLEGYLENHKTVLKNIPKVQDVIDKARPKLDKLRSEVNLPPLESYL